MKKFRSSQTSTSKYSCIELSKTQFSPASIADPLTPGVTVFNLGYLMVFMRFFKMFKTTFLYPIICTFTYSTAWLGRWVGRGGCTI